MADDNVLWPRYQDPADVDVIETVPLPDRGVPATTLDALERAARLWPQRVALTVLPNGEAWREAADTTYAELADDVRSFANVLHAVGAARGQAVALLSPNTCQLIPALLAAQAVGVAAPINPALRAGHVAHLLQASHARVLIAAGPELDAEIWAGAREAAREHGLTALLALRPTGALGPGPALETVDGVRVEYLEVLAASQPGDRLLATSRPEAQDLAAYFHTGGTTGLPKLAAHTHEMEMADAWAVAAMTDLDADAVALAALPLFHVNALVVTLLAPLLRGRRVVWAGPLGYRDPAFMRSFWTIVEAHRIGAMSAVPLVYSALTSVPVDADISSLRMCIVGAAPLPPAVTAAFLEHTGRQLCEGYGLTEATCASARSFVDHPRPRSCGQRLPYQRIRAVRIDPDSDTWTPVPDGELGEIVIAGPVVFPGYVVGHTSHGPILDPMGKIRDGWLATGDLGSVSPDGFVTLAGRSKDVIIRGGHNIDPGVIEDVLRGHPAVVDAGVVASPDERAGEVPVAFVTVRTTDVTESELLSWAAARVPEPASAPKSVLVLDALPVTAVGKPYKPALRLIAARSALHAQLEARGVTIAGDDWCSDEGGVITLRIPHVADESEREAVTALLEKYPFTWSFTDG
jgi:fatty-acyl-CoA synthase